MDSCSDSIGVRLYLPPFQPSRLIVSPRAQFLLLRLPCLWSLWLQRLVPIRIRGAPFPVALAALIAALSPLSSAKQQSRELVVSVSQIRLSLDRQHRSVIANRWPKIYRLRFCGMNRKQFLARKIGIFVRVVS